MLSAPDPLEGVLHAFRDAVTPLESAAKGLESHWLNLTGGARNVESTKRYRGSVKGNVVTVVASEERKKDPFKCFFDGLFPIVSGENDVGSPGGISSKKGRVEEEPHGSCANCSPFSFTWSFMLDSFLQAFPKPLKSARKCFGKQRRDDDSPSRAKARGKRSFKIMFWDKIEKTAGEGDALPVQLILCFALDSLGQNLQMFNWGFQGNNTNLAASEAQESDYLKIIKGLVNGKKADFDGFLSNLSFARVGSVPATLVEDAPSVKDNGENHDNGDDKEGPTTSTPQKIASGLLSIPLSNVERLKSTLSTVSLTELIEFIPQLGKSSTDHPDKKKLFSVQDFFSYTETEGRRFFEELDRDGDGQVNLEDLEIAMKKRKLPKRYAKDFLQRTRSNLFSKSIGWKQFLSLMEQKEPKILRAYTSLCLNKSGTLQKNQILASLRDAGLPAGEDNAISMMRYLNVGSEGSISYSHFRNFMLLLPSERLEDDPRLPTGEWLGMTE